MSRPVTGYILLSSLIFSLIASPLEAQDEDGFFPPQQIGAGGAAAVMSAQLSLPALDDRLADLGLEPLPGSLTLFGGEGIVNIGHVLIGFSGFGGQTQFEATAGGVYREATVSLEYSGLVLGWVKAAGKFKFSLGAAIGLSRLTVRTIRRPAAGSNWTDLWEPYGTAFPGPVAAADLETAMHIEGSCLSLAPRLNARWWFLPFLALDVGASYRLGTIAGGKLTADGREIPGSPELDLSGVGLRAGLFLGF